MNVEKVPAPHGEDHVFAPVNAILPTALRDSGEVSAPIPDIQRIVLFNDIAGGTPEVIIEHEGQRYRLRATRNGRLLLNK